jgi:hypothetical protein
LVDRSDLRGSRGFAVSDGRKTEEIARKLGAARVEDEGSSHSEGSAEKAGLENDVVPRGSLTGLGGRGFRRRARARPVIPSEHQSGKIHFVGEFEEALQSGRPRIEGCRPRLDVRDVLQTACECRVPEAAWPAFLTSPRRFGACPSTASRPQGAATREASIPAGHVGSAPFGAAPPPSPESGYRAGELTFEEARCSALDEVLGDHDLVVMGMAAGDHGVHALGHRRHQQQRHLGKVGLGLHQAGILAGHRQLP